MIPTALTCRRLAWAATASVFALALSACDQKPPARLATPQANASSANYTLTTQLSTADAVNTWAVNGTSFTNSTSATATAAGTYGSNVPVTLAITIPFTTASGTTISNVVNFTATAN